MKYEIVQIGDRWLARAWEPAPTNAIRIRPFTFCFKKFCCSFDEAKRMLLLIA